MERECELVDAWRSGDEQAGEALVEAYFPALHRFVRNKIDHGVEDLIQSTFLACLEGRDRFEGRSSFRAYLFGIARHLLYERYRKKATHGADFVAERSSVADLETGVSTLVRRRSDEEQLYRALRCIPVEQQLILELYFWESMTAREIGEVLDQPEGSIRTKIRRARLQLRERLEAEGSETFDSIPVGGGIEAWANSIRERWKPPA
ncbi:MAG: sigma-70 family RNA polymerase sigma factor [Myxococcota bacterium]